MVKVKAPAKKMGGALKGTLIGAGVGALGTVALLGQATARQGHAEGAEWKVRFLEHELRNQRTLPVEARDFHGERLLESELVQAKKWADKYVPDEAKRAATLRSAAKYPIPAGAALGAGIGSLPAWRQKRRAKQPRRPQHRR